MASYNDNDTAKLLQAAVDGARSHIQALLTSDPSLRPAFLRLAFYDAILHNPSDKVGGPKGSMRFPQESVEELKIATDRLERIKTTTANVKYYVSYADLYQLAGVEAMKSISGLNIEFHYGRMDSCIPIPVQELEQMQQGDDATNVRSMFYRLGFNDKEIVALSSAITYWMNPSLFNSNTSGSTPTHLDLSIIFKYLVDDIKAKDISKKKESSTSNPNKQSSTSSNEIVPSTNTTTNLNYWKCLISDASFHKYVELFAQDPKQISMEYGKAHQKLSELGFKHFPNPIPMVDYHDTKHGIAFAVAMTILFGFMGFFYEVMRS